MAAASLPFKSLDGRNLKVTLTYRNLKIPSPTPSSASLRLLLLPCFLPLSWARAILNNAQVVGVLQLENKHSDEKGGGVVPACGTRKRDGDSLRASTDSSSSLLAAGSRLDPHSRRYSMTDYKKIRLFQPADAPSSASSNTGGEAADDLLLSTISGEDPEFSVLVKRTTGHTGSSSLGAIAGGAIQGVRSCGQKS